MGQISNTIGTPLYLYKVIELGLRNDFARVCIDVDDREEIPETIEVDIEVVGEVEILVEYRWKPDFCSVCKSVGHLDTNCIGVKNV